jgi:hypothetical protein
MIGWIYVASVSNVAGYLKIGHTVQAPDEHVQETDDFAASMKGFR